MHTTRKVFFHHGSVRSWRPCPGTRTGMMNVGQLHVLVTGPREASRWLWMLTFKNIYFNILSVPVLVLVPVPGLLWTSLNRCEAGHDGWSIDRIYKIQKYWQFICLEIFHFISTSYDAHLRTRRRQSSVLGKCRSVPPSIFVWCIPFQVFLVMI